jgi:hypothetical protein
MPRRTPWASYHFFAHCMLAPANTTQLNTGWNNTLIALLTKQDGFQLCIWVSHGFCVPQVANTGQFAPHSSCAEEDWPHPFPQCILKYWKLGMCLKAMDTCIVWTKEHSLSLRCKDIPIQYPDCMSLSLSGRKYSRLKSHSDVGWRDGVKRLQEPFPTFSFL